ncbi:iron complex transport system ATP-binding protein [Fontibacillus solani]|uniref:Iron complex transport system ATP-binding protein n=1 Tax=Fontibacillus solani TaxID=1572857 RepID=A0A7W3XRT7_9BACL|nr:ABC transporter ATP-binding protein [Fontibacillus solani]MBA9085878.1 iron complex transport system ATP-binding protein [Fontibacillus solani]
MIEVKQAAKSYGKLNVLRDISLKIETGEFVGIIGPNGSGKSTLLNLISGIEEPDQGEISLAGQPITSFSRKSLSQRLAVLQQDGLPSISYPVREVIEMGRFPFQDWRGREKGGNADDLLNQIMNRLELQELAGRPLSVLSGGQRQRVALGKVMAQQPEVLLLDEPTTYLDIRYQMQFMDLIASWQREEGLTVVAVMHDLNLASLYCDRLLILSAGKVIAEGTPDEILVPETIEAVFDVKSHTVNHPDTGVPQLLLQKRS